MAANPVFEDDYETYAGTRLFITPVRPAKTANTEQGCEALTNWREITVTSVGIYDGREYSTSSVSVVSTGRNRQKKGEYTFGESTFNVLWLPDQPGQILATTARDGYGISGFAVVDQNGGVSYFSAQVATFQEAGGGNNDARTGTLMLLRQSDTVVAATPVAPIEDDVD